MSIGARLRSSRTRRMEVSLTSTDAVDRLFPDRFPNQSQTLLYKDAPPRREEMAELVDDDEQIKKENDFEED